MRWILRQLTAAWALVELDGGVAVVTPRRDTIRLLPELARASVAVNACTTPDTSRAELVDASAIHILASLRPIDIEFADIVVDPLPFQSLNLGMVATEVDVVETPQEAGG